MKHWNLRGVTVDTWTRLAALLLALCNQVLAILGKEAIPLYEADLTQFVSLLLTCITALVGWWKNNSFTLEAQSADAARAARKAQQSVAEVETNE